MIMLERMARAAHNRARRNYVNLGPWEQLPKDAQAQGMDMADAMLEVLMNPTEDMIAKAQSRFENDLNGVGRTILGCVFVEAVRVAKEAK